MKIYKIKNPDGLYSTGGSSPKWTRKGKTWVALNHLRAHLTFIRQERETATARLKDPRVAERYFLMGLMRDRDPRKDPYTGCVVEEFEVVPLHTTLLSDGKMV